MSKRLKGDDLSFDGELPKGDRASAASLVERLEKWDRGLALSSVLRDDLLTCLRSRLSSPEGTRGDKALLIKSAAEMVRLVAGGINLIPPSELEDSLAEPIRRIALRLRDHAYSLSSPSSAPAATPAHISCDCPADAGEPCPLPAGECAARVSAATPAKELRTGLDDGPYLPGQGPRKKRLSAAERPTPTWQPIEEFFDKESDGRFLFVIAPKTADEAYIDTSDRPIIGDFTPYVTFGRYGHWSALSKATHFCRVPAPPGPGAQRR